MIPFLIVIAEILFLFLLSGRVKQQLYILLHRLTRSSKVAIAGLSILLYPGVVVHELSHIVVAIILFVKVKHLELYPSIEDGRVRSGSVATEKSDIIRRTLIGIAPLFSGIAIVHILTTSLVPDLQVNNLFGSISNFEFRILNFILLYLVFSISATMYSSRKDLQSMIIVAPILALFAGSLYAIGFQFQVLSGYIEGLSWLFSELSSALLLPVALQIAMFFLLQLTTRLIVRA